MNILLEKDNCSASFCDDAEQLYITSSQKFDSWKNALIEEAKINSSGIDTAMRIKIAEIFSNMQSERVTEQKLNELIVYCQMCLDVIAEFKCNVSPSKNQPVPVKPKLGRPSFFDFTDQTEEEKTEEENPNPCRDHCAECDDSTCKFFKKER